MEIHESIIYSHKKKSFIRGYSIFILLPLALLIIFFCYDKGSRIENGEVKIDQTLSFYIKSKKQSTGVRGGGIDNSIKSSYSVWGKTRDGRMAFIHVSDYRKFISYKNGDIVTTRFTTHKDKGDWGWTLTAEFLFKIWLIAFLFFFFRILLMGKKD